MLVSIFRIILLTISGYLYYLFIFKDMNSIPTILEVSLILSLVVVIIFNRAKSNKRFEEQSNIDNINNMPQDQFVLYVTEMYKRLGYNVNLPSEAEKKYCDLIMFHRRGKICLKCFNHEIDLSKVDLAAFTKQNEEFKRTKFMIIANSFCDEELKKTLFAKKIEVFDKDFLNKVIMQFQDNHDKKRSFLKFTKSHNDNIIPGDEKSIIDKDPF
ncbi:MAG: hypothetical protein ATN31_08205 [Candidatus Epulonipiscioides saccharophilum]|nr:MAG: hypothetical protein ATN31_08205 [Epulopiscium sp. AS2M-Bin001]